MSIFKNIFGANKEITRLNTVINEWVERGSTYEKQINELQDTIGKFMVEKESFTKQIEDLKAEQASKLTEVIEQKDKEVSNLVEVVKETTNSVEDKAIDLVASLGVEPNKVSISSTEVNPTDIQNQWLNLCKTNSKEASEFYKLNREVLIKLTGYKAK